jgi:outer membrane receptor for ferric coprogen and ferric-rhodotorulic acid
MANVGAVFTPLKSVLIAPYFQYVGIYYDSTSLSGRMKFGNYAVVNMHMQGDITKNIRLNLDLNNITNNKYEMPWQFQNPGFSALGSIQVIL